jgi:hypothetical protein
MPSIGMGIGIGYSPRKGGGLPYDIFVDSINGDDGNDGASPSRAFQSISAVSIQTGLRIGLARGSEWHEQLGTLAESATGVVVGAYGSGRLPILRADDVASADGWTPHGTYAGIWQRTWTHDAASGQFLSLWEDDVRMRWRSSEANLNAAADGLYVATTGVGGSSTIFYKPTSGDPATNGKVVTISRRHYGLVAGTNASGWTVRDIHTMRQLHNDGSLALYGVGAKAYRCLAEDGTRHNMFIGADGEAYDCVTWKSDWADRASSTAFIAFRSDAVGYAAKFVRCVAVMEIAKTSAAISAGMTIEGFYAHAASDATKWDEISYADCAAYGCTTGFTVNNCSSLISQRNYAEECRQGHNSASVVSAIDDLYVKGGGTLIMLSAYEHFGGDTTLNGVRSYATINSSRGDIYNNISTGSVRVERSVIVHAGDAGSTGNRFAINGNHATSHVESVGNIIVGATATFGFRAKGTGDAQDNNYSPNTINFELASSYNDFAAYRAANPSYDVDSVTTNPGLVDPANGDFTGTNVPAGMGLERPDVTYTAIPSDVALAAM